MHEELRGQAAKWRRRVNEVMKKIAPVFFLHMLSCLILWTVPALAANHCIRSGATGAGTGADWTDAYTDFPDTMVRGDTYYVASGTYGDHKFDTAEDGTKVIHIWKATVADHGTDTGWSDSYAGGQAVFQSMDSGQWWGCTAITFSTGYWDWDGKTGDYDSFTATANESTYGFKTIPCAGSHPSAGEVRVDYAVSAPFAGISIQHTSVSCAGVSVNTSQVGIGLCTSGTSNPGNSPIVARNYVANCQNSVTLCMTNSLLEYNYFTDQWSSETYHGEHIDGFAPNQGTTFRYNIVNGCAGSACMMSNGTGNVCGMEDWSIYGNLFLNNSTSNGIVSGGSAVYVKDVRLYNNTVVNSAGPILYQSNPGVSGAMGNIVKNNLLYNSYSDIPQYDGGTIDHDYNAFHDPTDTAPAEANGQYSTGNPFVNSAGGNYHLLAKTDNGAMLGSSYGTDPDGWVRGTDGYWVRGAFEFVYTPRQNFGTARIHLVPRPSGSGPAIIPR